ncbi:MAG TPA: hypothetical protein PL124_09595, partial [Candidatus Cloacimonadota bacterium]|nr:hypothetical protein [Candidatus Cloacimonadota bacterium]
MSLGLRLNLGSGGGVGSAPKATGGTITKVGNYYYHVFLTTGVFTPLATIDCEYLIIAGGGAGAIYNAGGGGAGGLLHNFGAAISLPVKAY